MAVKDLSLYSRALTKNAYMHTALNNGGNQMHIETYLLTSLFQTIFEHLKLALSELWFDMQLSSSLISTIYVHDDRLLQHHWFCGDILAVSALILFQ